MDFSELTREIKKIPPVTRFLCGGSLALTIPVMMKILSPQSIIYWWPYVKKFEIWRIPTSFLYGSTGINYIFDLVMLYRNSDALETGPYHRLSQNYAWQLMIACASILLVDSPLRAYTHLRPLLVCLTYLTSALAPPNTQSNFFGLITFPVKYMPHVMILMDFLIGGPHAAAQSIGGAIVGHIWWWGVFGRMGGGRTGILAPYGVAPSWVKNFVSSGGSGRTEGYEASTNEPPSARTTATRDTTAGTYQWGSGQRLGS